jgi:hypothetical protein
VEGSTAAKVAAFHPSTGSPRKLCANTPIEESKKETVVNARNRVDQCREHLCPRSDDSAKECALRSVAALAAMFISGIG